MKNFRLNFLSLTFILGFMLQVFPSCDGPINPDIEVDIFELSKDTVTMDNAAGSSTIQITSNTNWSVKVDSLSKWLSVSVSEGEGDGSFRINTVANTGSLSRSGIVYVSHTFNKNTVVKEIHVFQLGADPSLVIEYPKDLIPAIGGEYTIAVIANVQWEVSIPADVDWLEVKQTYADSVRILVKTNTNIQRTANVSIKAVGDFYITRTATLTQEKSTAVLNVSQDEFIIPFKNQTIKVPVFMGDNYEHFKVISNNDWIVWDEVNSTKDTVVLKIKDNDNSDFPRDAELTFNNVGINQSVKIFQYGKPNPRIGDDLTAGVLAFPGAEGGGRFTTGGRGGSVFYVTRLDDYAANEGAKSGTLRYAIERTAARVILFAVSGTIELKRPITIDHGNISIIGQTAPGDGITLKNYDFHVQPDANNVLIRFIRVRPGDQMGVELDAITGRWFSTGIVDHVSGSWSVDECMSFYGVKDFTLQWCMATESLNNSVHSKGAHGYGAMFSGDKSSFHHILLAHHASRMPRISALSEGLNPSNTSDHQGLSDIRNIVAYNWYGGGQGAYGGEYNPFNWINNYYKAGPATGTSYKSWRLMAADTTSRIFAEGSIATGNSSTALDNWHYGIWDQMTASQIGKDMMKMAVPHAYSKVTTHTAAQAYEKVASYAGACLRRDAVDKRIINEMLTGKVTYFGSVSGDPGIVDNINDVGGLFGAYPTLKSLPSKDTDNDGIPDNWEIAYGLNIKDASDALKYTLDDKSRYTNLEVYFHNLVQHIVYNQNMDGIQSEKI